MTEIYVERALARANSSLPSSNGGDGSQDTIFETLIAKYQKVVGRSEDIIIQQVCAEVESNLKAHFSVAAYVLILLHLEANSSLS